jgi:hypothetical protein
VLNPLSVGTRAPAPRSLPRVRRCCGTYARRLPSVQLTMQNRGEYAALLLKHLLFTRVQVGGWPTRRAPRVAEHTMQRTDAMQPQHTTDEPLPALAVTRGRSLCVCA